MNLVFMVLLAMTVAEAMQAVGALLVFALLLLPSATAHRLALRPFTGLGLAVVFAVVLTWVGLMIGFYSGLPSSVCISLLAFVAYAAVVGAYAARKGWGPEEELIPIWNLASITSGLVMK